MRDEVKEANSIQVVTWDEVAQHLSNRANTLRSLLGTIQSTFERNDCNVALFNLGYQVLVQVERAKNWLHAENDLLAGCVRALYELELILCYILQSEKNLNEWLGQIPNDEKEIAEGFLTLRDIYTTEINTSLNARISAVEQVCDNLEMTLQRPWRVQDLAERTGNIDEYRVFFKFLSKYIHPSAWLVNANPDRTNSNEYRNLLVGLVQIFVNRVIKQLCTEYNLEEPNEDGKLLWPWRLSSHDIFAISDLHKMHLMLEKSIDEYIKNRKSQAGTYGNQDVEALEMFAMWEYVTQRFDQSSRPQRFKKAARLYGATDALRRMLNGNDATADETSTKLMNHLRADLGEEVFANEFRSGQAMAFSEALLLALSESAS